MVTKGGGGEDKTKDETPCFVTCNSNFVSSVLHFWIRQKPVVHGCKNGDFTPL